MTPDEMAAKTEPAERQLAGAAVDNLLEEQLRATLKDLQTCKPSAKASGGFAWFRGCTIPSFAAPRPGQFRAKGDLQSSPNNRRRNKKATLARDCPLPNRCRAS